MLPTEKTSPLVNLNDYTILIYGAAKVGKSTFASQAGKVLFMATEPGLNALSVYKVDITKWEDILETFAELAATKHEFTTVVIDTVDNAYLLCADWVCRKNNVKHESEMEYGKGFGFVQREFMRVITRAAQFNFGLILVSHAREKEVVVKSIKTIKTTTTLPDKVNEKLMGFVDMILYCDIDAALDKSGAVTERRVIRTKPSKNYDAGDRTNRLTEVVDLNYSEFKKVFEAGEPKTEVVEVKAPDPKTPVSKEPAKPKTQSPTKNNGAELPLANPPVPNYPGLPLGQVPKTTDTKGV
jgi:hypothetical protein